MNASFPFPKSAYPPLPPKSSKNRKRADFWQLLWCKFDVTYRKLQNIGRYTIMILVQRSQKYKFLGIIISYILVNNFSKSYTLTDFWS